MNNGPTILIAAACFALLGLAGCNAAGKVSRSQVLSDYESRRYEQSYAGAELLARRSSGGARDEARYIAGVSAYRLGKADDAISYLRPVTRAGDAAMAGQAAATIGLIYADRRRDAEAMEHLRQAARQLEGEDRAQVHYHMGLIEQRAGHWAQARTHLSTALSDARAPALRRAARQRMSTDSFAIQFGAYSRPKLANGRAGRIRPAVHRARIGTVRVVASVTELGEQLYLVQAGHFATHAAAVQALRRVGDGEAMIVPAAK